MHNFRGVGDQSEAMTAYKQVSHLRSHGTEVFIDQIKGL